MAYPNDPPAPSGLTLTSNTINDNLVAWWPMTDGSGGIADISGNGYDGVATDSPTWATTAKGAAPAFPSTARFEVPQAMWNDNISGGTEWSVSGWYYATAVNTDQTVGINCWDGVGSKFLLRFDASRLQVLIFDGTLIQTSGTTVASQAGVWEHFVATVDMTGEIKIYLNKTLVNTKTFSTRTFGSLVDDPAIGASTSGSRAFGGHKQNIRLFNRILSLSDVETLHDDPWAGTDYSPNEVTSNVNLLDPATLKHGLIIGSNLKPSLTSPTYAGGTPSSADDLKPSLTDSEGNLKPSLVNADGNLKASLKR